MINFIKVLISIAVLLILAYPLIPGRGKALKLFPASGLRYDTPHNRKNFSFIILAVCEFVLACLLFFLISRATNFIVNIPILGQLFTDFTNQFSSQIDFIMFTVKIVVVNFILLYAFVIVKAFLKKAILDPAFGLTKKKKKKGKKKNAKKDEKNEENKDSESTENTDTESGESEDDGSEDPVKKRKKLRIPRFLHSLTESGEDEETDNGEDTDNGEEENKPRKYGKFESFVYGIFFEGESFEMARAWVVRVRTILQCFIVLVEILYVIFLALILVSAFFPLPMGLYNFLINTLRIGRWYIYPIISILFLQEICNVFRTPVTPFKPDEKKIEQLKKKEQRRLEARLRKLLGVLKKHFDADHSLRF